MRLALDTNRYSDFWNGDQEVARKIESAQDLYLPFVAIGELRAGFLNGTRQAANERALREFLSKPGVQVLIPDEATTAYYATLQHQLRIQGTPIPTNDIWIAALTLQHGLILYARDKHFDCLPQLQRL